MFPKDKRFFNFKNEENSNFKIEISEATKLNINKTFLHLDEISKDKFRLTFTKYFIEDFTQIKEFLILKNKIEIINHNNEIIKTLEIFKISKINSPEKRFYIENSKIIYNLDIDFNKINKIEIERT